MGCNEQCNLENSKLYRYLLLFHQESSDKWNSDYEIHVDLKTIHRYAYKTIK